jgi:hypothetical protein
MRIGKRRKYARLIFGTPVDARRHWVDHLPFTFQVVLHGLPRELNGDLESSRGTLFLECRKCVDAAIDRFTKTTDGPLEALKSLLPTNTVGHRDSPSDDHPSHKSKDPPSLAYLAAEARGA